MKFFMEYYFYRFHRNLPPILLNYGVSFQEFLFHLEREISNMPFYQTISLSTVQTGLKIENSSQNHSTLVIVENNMFKYI